MQRVVILWVLSGMVLASGALLVCGDARCLATELDRAGLGAAHDLRKPSLDHLMAANRAKCVFSGMPWNIAHIDKGQSSLHSDAPGCLKSRHGRA